MTFAANSALASRSSAFGRFKSAKTFPELFVNSRIWHFSPHFPANLRALQGRCRMRLISFAGVAIPLFDFF